MTREEQNQREFEEWLILRFPHPYNLFRTDKRDVLMETWLASRRLMREREGKMKIYPDLLNNPNGDPRIAQQQYEDWKREIEEAEDRKDREEGEQ